MANPNIFASGQSGLNAFLYADIGVVDANGMLTMASLLGRRGDDPWEEAARLAGLPTREAVASLAGAILGASTGTCSLPEATALAEALVALLPRATPAERLLARGQRARGRLLRWPFGRLAAAAAGLLVLVAVAAVWLALAGLAGPDDRTGMTDPFARAAPR